MLNKKNINKVGFSLVEVLVFVVVVSFFFTAAASVASYMIRTAKINERKIIASRYAEELAEWLRSEKEIDWNVFAARADPGGTTAHCFNTLSWTSTCGVINGVFTRNAYLQEVTNAGFVYQVNVTVNVTWSEAGKVYSVPIKTTFSVWETGATPTP